VAEDEVIVYFGADEPGLTLRLSEHGRKTWSCLYRAQGSRRLRRLTLGTYPAVTLADARRLALENRYSVQVNGESPADAKAAWKEIKSFGELAAWYLKEYATKRKRSWKEDRRILDKELLPAWRDRKASDVSRSFRFSSRPRPKCSRVSGGRSTAVSGAA
jgi:hypothetical protein